MRVLEPKHWVSGWGETPRFVINRGNHRRIFKILIEKHLAVACYAPPGTEYEDIKGEVGSIPGKCCCTGDSSVEFTGIFSAHTPEIHGVSSSV